MSYFDSVGSGNNESDASKLSNLRGRVDTHDEDISNRVEMLSLDDKDSIGNVDKAEDTNRSAGQGSKVKKFFIDTSPFTSTDSYLVDSGKSSDITLSNPSSLSKSRYFVDSLSNYTSPENVSSLLSSQETIGERVNKNINVNSIQGITKGKYFLEIAESADSYSTGTEGYTPPVSQAPSPTYVNNAKSFSFTQPQTSYSTTNGLGIGKGDSFSPTVSQASSPTYLSNVNYFGQSQVIYSADNNKFSPPSSQPSSPTYLNSSNVFTFNQPQTTYKFSPTTSQASSPTFINSQNSFSFAQSQVPPTQSPSFRNLTNMTSFNFMSNYNQAYPNIQTQPNSSVSTNASGDLLKLQLGNIVISSVVPVSKSVKQEPPKPPAIVTDGLVYRVQFKRNIRYYVVLPGYNKEIKLKDYVKVYADRGEDLGFVTGFMSPRMFYDLKSQHSRNSPNKDEEAKWDLKYIFRLASTYEKQQLPDIHKEEDDVMKNAKKLAIIYSLPLVIVDVEYQFDKNKITILYESNKRVDFREFVRDLFAIYKTRIWMQQVSYGSTNRIDTNQINPNQFYSTSNPMNPSNSINNPSPVNMSFPQANNLTSQSFSPQNYDFHGQNVSNYSMPSDYDTMPSKVYAHTNVLIPQASSLNSQSFSPQNYDHHGQNLGNYPMSSDYANIPSKGYTHTNYNTNLNNYEILSGNNSITTNQIQQSNVQTNQNDIIYQSNYYQNNNLVNDNILSDIPYTDMNNTYNINQSKSEDHVNLKSNEKFNYKF